MDPRALLESAIEIDNTKLDQTPGPEARHQSEERIRYLEKLLRGSTGGRQGPV